MNENETSSFYGIFFRQTLNFGLENRQRFHTIRMGYIHCFISSGGIDVKPPTHKALGIELKKRLLICIVLSIYVKNRLILNASEQQQNVARCHHLHHSVG